MAHSFEHPIRACYCKAAMRIEAMEQKAKLFDNYRQLLLSRALKPAHCSIGLLEHHVLKIFIFLPEISYNSADWPCF